MATLGDLNLPTFKGLVDGTLPQSELERRLNDNFATLRDSLKTLEADKQIFHISWFLSGNLPAASANPVGGFKSVDRDGTIIRAVVSAVQRGSAGSCIIDLRRVRPVGAITQGRGNTGHTSLFQSLAQKLRINGGSTTSESYLFAVGSFTDAVLREDDFLALVVDQTDSVTKPVDVTVDLFVEAT
jgi:hypothetical protein